MAKKAWRDMDERQRELEKANKRRQSERKRERECVATHGITLSQMDEVRRLFRDLKSAAKAARPVRVKLSAEERAERNRVAARKRYQNLSPDERHAISRRVYESMTDEQREKKRERDRAWRESMSPEQIAARRERDREYERRRSAKAAAIRPPRVKLSEEEAKERARVKLREWRAANPDKVRAHRKYHKHRRRVAQLDSDISSADVAHLVASASVCPCCGVRMVGEPGPAQKQLDHIIPLNVGGTHTLANVRVICRTCNLRRPKDGSDLEGFQPALWSVSVGAPVFG